MVKLSKGRIVEFNAETPAYNSKLFAYRPGLIPYHHRLCQPNTGFVHDSNLDIGRLDHQTS